MQRLRPHLPNRLRDERGSMVVEFGLMLPLLVILISGLVEFGIAYSLRMNLTHAAREGVRVYSLVKGGDYVAAAQAAAPTGQTVVVTSSGNCPDPSTPPSPPVQATVTATIEHEMRFAFLFDTTQTLAGRGVMRCGG